MFRRKVKLGRAYSPWGGTSSQRRSALFDLNPDAVNFFSIQACAITSNSSETGCWLAFVQITPHRAIPPLGKNLDKFVHIKSDISNYMRLTEILSHILRDLLT